MRNIQEERRKRKGHFCSENDHSTSSSSLATTKDKTQLNSTYASGVRAKTREIERESKSQLANRCHELYGFASFSFHSLFAVCSMYFWFWIFHFNSMSTSTHKIHKRRQAFSNFSSTFCYLSRSDSFVSSLSVFFLLWFFA